MKLDFPATGRNRDAILEVLRTVLPSTGRVLEVASGSGQHVAHFAAHLPQLTFQPTDIEPDHLASIDAWCADLANVQPALHLDVMAPWPVDQADGVWCANMIHIAPWSCTQALIEGAARLLSKGQPLVLYGPFQRDGVHTSESNAHFDVSLQARNPDWGVRDLSVVEAVAQEAGLACERIVEMPANNLTVVFR